MRLTELVALIVERLTRVEAEARQAFEASKHPVGVRHPDIDALLPAELALQISERCPVPDPMHLIDSLRERRHTTKDFDAFDPLMKTITSALQAPEVVEVVERIMGIRRLRPDPSLFAGAFAAKNHAQPSRLGADLADVGRFLGKRPVELLQPSFWPTILGGKLRRWRDAARA